MIRLSDYSGYEQPGQEPKASNGTLRIIAWLLFALLAIDGAYLYFQPHAQLCNLSQGVCVDVK